MANTKIAAAIQAKIRNPAKRYLGIYHFRELMPEGEYFSAYRKIFPLKGSLQDYHGPAFPRSASQLFSSRTPREASNAVREMLWGLARATVFSQEIADFLTQRVLFEKAILRSDYESASAVLDGIESAFGKSIWLYQNRIACSYISPRDSAPAEMARKTLEEVHLNGRLHVLVYFIAKRAEGANLRDKIREDIAESVQSPIYKSYYQAKVFDLVTSSEQAVSSRLFVDSQASVIDHYESLVHCLQAATSDDMLPAELTSPILKAVNRLYRETSDSRLGGVVTMLGGPVNFNALSLRHATRAQSIERYTAGDYPACKSLTKGLLDEDPTDGAMRVLYVKACVALDEALTGSENIGELVNQHLFSVLSAGAAFFKGAHNLFILADRFADHCWALYLRVVVMYEITPEQDKNVQDWMRDMFTRDPYTTPFTALCMVAPEREAVIEKLKTAGKFPITSALVEDVIGSKCSNKLDIRVARYRARFLLVQKCYVEATALYIRVVESDTRAAVKLRCAGGAALALMLDGKYLEAVDMVVGAYMNSPDAPTLLPTTRLVECLPDIDLWPNSICMGILLSLDQQVNGEPGDMSIPRLAFERFCTENEIYTPFQLLARSDQFGVDFVAAYLKYVWQPEVMRQTLIYNSAEEIEEARIEACKVLAQVDPENAKVYHEELASRIKQQEIAKTTALVEKSKVHVDIEAIKRSLKGRLKNPYAQYKGSVGAHGKSIDDLLRKFENAVAGMEGQASVPFLLSKVHLVDFEEPPSQADIQFTAIFEEISKEFLTGDHGLNAYLSTRVRHGKFVDALRKAVMDEHLVTAKNSSGEYSKNVYWQQRVPEDAAKEALVALVALDKFSSTFDDLLSKTRDERIQIQSFYGFRPGDKQSAALFKYFFSTLEKKLFQRYDADFKDLDELIVRCVDALWEKTDDNLSRVRLYLEQLLRVELMEAFNQLDAELSVVAIRTGLGGLQNATARARTATQQALENVIGWFRRSEVYDRKDFDIDFPPQIAAAMVNRTMSIPNPWIGPQCAIETADAQLPGRSLDTLVDIFYVLFENAVKHSQDAGVALRVDISLSYVSGDFRGEVLSDAGLPSDEQLSHLEHLRETLATPESRRLAQGEGRSGFRKIYIALDSPLYKNPLLSFGYEGSKFRVVFSFKTAELQ
ncbi:hypothetical protein [Roseateles sp.]|uniref:hypothetical protein n=1 Tax=Roseateles sp. TaxID=1971397 RepID=UPI0032654572